MEEASMKKKIHAGAIIDKDFRDALAAVLPRAAILQFAISTIS